MPRWFSNWIAIIASLPFALLAQRVAALSGEGEHVDAVYNLPSDDAGYYNVDVNFRPLVDPGPIKGLQPAFYYASSFTVRGVDDAGHETAACAYMGLQKDGAGKRAIFSIWGGTAAASDAAGAKVEEFTEISCRDYPGGWHILLPFDWTTHTYRFRVWALSESESGLDYGAWILDTDTGVETALGTIRVPAGWRGLDSEVVLFSEWYGGDFPACRSLPRSDVLFGVPTGNAGGVTATYSGHVDIAGACPGSFQDLGTYSRHKLPR